MNASIQHEFIAIDEGRGTLLHVNESDPTRDWVVPIGQPQARDLQLVGGNRMLVSHHHGYTEFDIATGRRLKEFDALAGVTAARRQPNRHTLIAGVDVAGATGLRRAGAPGTPHFPDDLNYPNLAGSNSASAPREGVVVLELDENDREIHRVVFPGDYVRLIRQTNDGTCLMCCNDRIREGSPVLRSSTAEGGRAGKYLREFPVEGFYHAWKAVRLANGNLLVSAGYGAFMVELDPAGRILRKFGGKGEVPAAVHPFFYAMFQLLADGHIVMANWQGHGDGHGAEGIPLLEFGAAGKIVWQWNRAELISSLQGVLVLDGLDFSKLHDERNGMMTPAV